MAPSTSTSRHLLFALLLLTGAALLFCVYGNLPLDLPLLGLVGLGLLVYLGVRYPEWFLVASMFAPQWKTFWIFKTLDRYVDLTVAMLLCLAAGLVWRLLTQVGRPRSWKLRTIFFGQLNSILVFLAFAAIVAVSYFYTSAPDYGASKLVRFLVIGSFLLIAPFFLILTENDFRSFARIFVGFSGATAIQLIGTLELRTQDETTDITRIGAGWLMGMAVILVLFYPLVRSRNGQRVIFIFMLPLTIAGLMASAARGPIVALAVAVLIGLAIWLGQGRLRGRTALILLLLIVGGLGGAYFVFRQADSGKYTAKADEFKTLFTEGTSSGSAGKRLDYYRTTLAAIPDHFLFGTGIGSWSSFYYKNDSRNYPHNLFLEITFEEGLLGLATLSTFLFLVGVSTMRMLRASRFHFLALGLIVLYCVIVSLFSGDLDDNRLLWLWIGITLSICRTVRLYVTARRSVLRPSREPSTGRLPPSEVPAFSGRFATERRPVARRGRAWREKFVY